MSYMDNVFQDYSLMSFNPNPFHKYYESPVIFPTISVPPHSSELDGVPTVLYTFYPVMPLNENENVSSIPKPYLVNSYKEQMALDYDSANTGNSFMTSTPEHGNTNYRVGETLCEPSDFILNENISQEEVEEDQNMSMVSTLNNSFDNEREKSSLTNNYGYFGIDGCWYPKFNNSVSSSLDSYKNLDSADLNEKSCKQGDSNKVPFGIIPPSKLMMPETLMSYYNYYQRLDLPSSTLGRPHLVHTFSSDGNMVVEELWLAHMKLLFRNFPHTWNLGAADPLESFDDSWNVFKDLAKVRFYCQKCLDGWTSMFGVVVFFYSFNNASSCGEIWYQVSGQKCGKCNADTFEMPLWYPEEAQKVITNLYYEIASRIYGLRTPQHIRTRRLGQPVNQHNKDLCQGCSHGLCKQDSALNSNDPDQSDVHGPTSSSSRSSKENEGSLSGANDSASSCFCVRNNYTPFLSHPHPPLPPPPPPQPLPYYDVECQYSLTHQKGMEIPYPAFAPQMAILFPVLPNF